MRRKARVAVGLIALTAFGWTMFKLGNNSKAMPAMSPDSIDLEELSEPRHAGPTHADTRPETVRTRLPQQLPPNSSLIGLTSQPSVGPAELDQATLARVDVRLWPVYQNLVGAADRARSSPAFTPRAKLSADRYDALVQLTKQLRFYYVGDNKQAPSPTNTNDYRYTRMNSNGFAVIWQFSRWEFPQLFDLDDHPEKYAPPARLSKKIEAMGK